MEYEYSYKVSSLDEYIKYLKSNHYALLNTFKQTRTIYRNPNKTMARITIEENDKTIMKLDFKEDKLTNEDLTIRKESESLEFDDLSSAESILDFLGYKKDNTLIRTRYIYSKKGVKFELDHYEYPEDTYVVAIEGIKEEVDQVYNELSEINKLYKI